jgi:hypothetical protein
MMLWKHPMLKYLDAPNAAFNLPAILQEIAGAAHSDFRRKRLIIWLKLTKGVFARNV